MSGIMNMLVGTGSSGLQLGDAYGGGFYAGQINISGTIYNLVVADRTVGQSYSYWGTSNTSATSDINGPSNSALQAASGCTPAQFCENLNTGGYTDWYLPSKWELQVLYWNLKPTTNTNYGSPGTNPYYKTLDQAAGWSSGNPSQTTATAFRSTGAQYIGDPGVSNGWLLFSSTAGGLYGNPFYMYFNTGQNNYLGVSPNNSPYSCRAIRRVLA